MSRLGGSKMTVKFGLAHELLVSTHDSMSHAIQRARRGQKHYSKRKPSHEPLPESIYHEMLHGDSKLDRLQEEADRLMDEALVEDPRLVRRAGWVRDDDGMDADPSLVACGEERCCLNRKRLKVSEASTLEPVRVVISTDSKKISDDHAVAFMAAAKLSQQFRPLEIWWQGAWLDDDGHDPKGHVSLTPLLRNELDFGRLQFVLSNTSRDNVSFRIMFGYTMGDTEAAQKPAIKYGPLTGKQSFLPDTLDFVDEAGIQCHPYTIARYAAKWAGLPSIWRESVDGNEAEQTWNPKPYEYTPPSDAERRRWEQDSRRRQAEQQAKANERLANV